MKTKQQRYRERLQEAGYRQIAVWLNGDAYALLQRVMTIQQIDAADAISTAIRCYHSATIDELALSGVVPSDSAKVTSDVPSDLAPVTSDVPSDLVPVTSDVPSDLAPVTSDVPSDPQKVMLDVEKSGRYMSPALEDHILALRESGLSLNATARRLADEGHFNAKSEPYGTATVSKAEARAKARRVAPPL